jgi:hypothetical protein
MKVPGTILLFCASLFQLKAQHYTATFGSSYSGSLNTHNNPASIVNAPFRWDITLLGIQDKHTTNFIEVHNYSLLSNPVNSEYLVSNGRFKRHGDLNFNINLFNTRIALNKKNAIAFGANIRSAATLKTTDYNFVDTLQRFGDFFHQNEGAGTMALDISAGGWAELYATYAGTILDNEYGRLNAGITFKLNRGLSAAFVRLANGNFIRNADGSTAEYTITGADLDFGYSSNFDRWNSERKFNTNAGDFFSFTEGGGSFDVGVEYLVKLQSTPSMDDDTWFDYNWKLGLSVMDIGYAQYHFGKYSTRARNVRAGVTDLVMDGALDSTITNLGDLRDSLTRVFNTVGTYGGKFRVAHPTRLNVNVDKFVNDAFYINADLSLNLASIGKSNGRYVKDMSLLTITPRWETRKKGFYLPVYYNTRSQLWIGGAVRVGPITFGLHNWSNLISKKKMHRGGGYLAITIRASRISGDKTDKRLNCYPLL